MSNLTRCQQIPPSKHIQTLLRRVMDTFYRWNLSSRQESLKYLKSFLTEQQQRLLYAPVLSVVMDIFWTCITFQNRGFLKRGPAVHSGWDLCLRLWNVGTELDVTEGWGSWCQLYSHTQYERKDREEFSHKTPKKHPEYIQETPRAFICLWVFSQGSALALNLFRVMLLFLMLMLD